MTSIKPVLMDDYKDESSTINRTAQRKLAWSVIKDEQVIMRYDRTECSVVPCALMQCVCVCNDITIEMGFGLDRNKETKA